MTDIISPANSYSVFPRNTSAKNEIVNTVDDSLSLSIFSEGKGFPALFSDDIELSESIIDDFYNGHDDHYASDTDALESLPFAKYGLVCRRSFLGPKNNLDLEQCRLETRSFEWIGLSSKNDHRLAFYVLTQFTKTPHYRIADDRVDDLVVDHFCKCFTDEMLNDIPLEGGQIPFSIICRWIERKRHDI